MSRSSDESLGRRRFQLRREQAIESAIEKIRRAPAVEWHSFSDADYSHIRKILGDLWVHLGREKWDQYVFSSVTRQDIRDIIDLGTCPPDRALPCKILDEVDGILSHSRNTSHKP
ncbi:hypothetical protein [Methanoregula sp.]|uniref:hypothetical protein n=1 Tax=Methanoregula sp. TaxID=2052170 RepID=UPI0035642D8F